MVLVRSALEGAPRPASGTTFDCSSTLGDDDEDDDDDDDLFFSSSSSSSKELLVAASEYRKVPRIATAADHAPTGVIGFLNTATDASMITTRFTAFATDISRG